MIKPIKISDVKVGDKLYYRCGVGSSDCAAIVINKLSPKQCMAQVTYFSRISNERYMGGHRYPKLAEHGVTYDFLFHDLQSYGILVGSPPHPATNIFKDTLLTLPAPKLTKKQKLVKNT